MKDLTNLPGVIDDNDPLTDNYDQSLLNYSPDRPFVVPTVKQLGNLVETFTDLTVKDAVDSHKDMDNRLAVRILLWKHTNRQISHELLTRLVEPYDNGFYKKSDGKSTPFPFFKLNRDQELAGIEKDIVSVRHDLDYFRGRPSRLEADLFYLLCQHCIGSNWILNNVEYISLRLMGHFAWRKEKKKRVEISGYGGDEYIKNL